MSRITAEEYRSLHVDKSPKYRNRKADGYDSEKEKTRHGELLLLEKAGLICGLKRQVPFVLISAQRDENGKMIEKSVRYYADFQYFDVVNKMLVIEDVKSPATRKNQAYVIKRKLMLERYGIKILEV